MWHDVVIGEKVAKQRGYKSITGSLFTRNAGGSRGGGAYTYISHESGEIVCANNIFGNNTAVEGGGGILMGIPG
jgi:hypothetical protein